MPSIEVDRLAGWTCPQCGLVAITEARLLSVAMLGDPNEPLLRGNVRAVAPPEDARCNNCGWTPTTKGEPWTPSAETGLKSAIADVRDDDAFPVSARILRRMVAELGRLRALVPPEQRWADPRPSWRRRS